MKYIKYIFIACSIACFGLNQNLLGEAQITVFLRPYPQFIITQEEIARSTNKYAAPGYASKQKIKGLIDQNLVNGIFATYGGFITTSSPDGQISFPRKHDAPLIHLIATSRVTPITMNSTTIAHWELEEQIPAMMYRIERKQDPTTHIFFWDVTEEELPQDHKLPLTSLLLFAKPENIYIPTGITVTDNTPNLLLPDIDVKPGINKLSNAFYVLYLRHFFGPVSNALKKEKTQYAVNLKY